MNDPNKQKLYFKQAEIIKAVSHPVRVAVIDYLAQGEQCVCDIAEYVKSERSNVSRHLSVMVSAGVLESRKDGLQVFYRIKTPCIVNFIGCITEVIKHQAMENQNLLKAI